MSRLRTNPESYLYLYTLFFTDAMNESIPVFAEGDIITLYPAPIKINTDLRSTDMKVILPKYQNRMVAEVTTDMFMSGLMCE